jgi:NTE family protein
MEQKKNMQNKKCGLVLSLGAAPGLAHIGVIKVLSQNNIQFDAVAGSSIGAFIGACFARHGDVAKVEKAFLEIDLKEIPKLIDPRISVLSKGLVSGEKVKKFLESIIGDIEFKDLKIPLAVIATDVNTGEEVVFKEGSVLDAVRASISMPGVFVPVKIDDRYLIDGGSVNPLPVDIVKKMGSEYIVVSNIVPSPIKRETSLQGKKDKKQNIASAFLKRIFTQKNEDEDMPDMFSVVAQAMHITEYKIASSRLEEADFVITPDISGIDTLDFTKAKEAIKKGEEAAMKEMEKIKTT